jgi:RNA polymerase sigma factor (sigma-70 family)
MLQHSHVTSEPTDETCLARVRAGDRSAYDHLYRRHHGAAVRAAAAIGGQHLADEHAAEAFARVLELLLAGKGPQDNFRAYLIRAIRNIHFNHHRQTKRVLLHDSPAEKLRPDLSGDAWEDLFDSETAAAAFTSLPERWRRVLWLHTVEDRSVTEISEELGISPGAVSQLSFRAREALRTAYLAAHLQEPTAAACQPVVSRLPQVVRGGAAARPRPVEEHLRTCRPCTERASEIAAISVHMSGARPTRERQRRTGCEVRPQAVAVSPTVAR